MRQLRHVTLHVCLIIIPKSTLGPEETLQVLSFRNLAVSMATRFSLSTSSKLGVFPARTNAPRLDGSPVWLLGRSSRKQKEHGNIKTHEEATRWLLLVQRHVDGVLLLRNLRLLQKALSLLA